LDEVILIQFVMI